MDIYLNTDFYEQPFHCSNCSWKGEGKDTNIIDFYGVTEVKEIHCPNCDNTLGGLKDDDKGGESADPFSFQIG